MASLGKNSYHKCKKDVGGRMAVDERWPGGAGYRGVEVGKSWIGHLDAFLPQKIVANAFTRFPAYS